MNINVIFAFLLSLAVSAFATYRIVKISNSLGFGDSPSEKRKIHKRRIPNLGGVAVFIATVVSYFAFVDYSDSIRPDKIFSISIFLFFIGLKDDMEPISARSRFLFEFICAFFIIIITEIQITTLWGIFGIQEVSSVTSYILTSIFIVGCINAYNLIDGVDGLLGSLALLGVICFGIIFNYSNEWLWTLLCICICGALLGFLIYNWHPANIFMGNGGALFLGTIFSCISLRVMQLDPEIFEVLKMNAPHAMAFGIISIPITDMLVVFLLRLKNKRSPFLADNRHIHHVLLRMNFSHSQVTLFLVFINLIIIVFAYFIQSTGALKAILFTILFVLFIEFLIRVIARYLTKNESLKTIN